MTKSHSRTPVVALLGANTLSFIAEAIATVAIPWFVLNLTGSYAQMGIVGFFTVLPRVIATFLGGQVVDRVGFRTASIASDLLSGISICGIPILYATGDLTFTWLIVLVIIGAVFDGPGATAKEAMVPELVETAHLDIDRVNAFFQASRRLSYFIGPILAGVLVAWVGTSDVLWVNAVVFAVSALITATLIPRVAPPEPDEGSPSTFWANTVFGFRFLRQHRLLLWLAGILSLMNFLDAPLATVQLPALVHEHYGSAERLGVLLSAVGAGAVVGTLLFSAVAPRLSRRATFITCFFVMGLTGVVISTVPPYPVAVAVMALFGFASGPLNPILMSIRQERVPMPYRARVFGTTTAIAFVAIPLGQLVGGYLIDWLGVQTFIAAVAMIYLAVVVSLVFNPVLHEMDQPPVPGPSPTPLHAAGPETPAR